MLLSSLQRRFIYLWFKGLPKFSNNLLGFDIAHRYLLDINIDALSQANHPQALEEENVQIFSGCFVLYRKFIVMRRLNSGLV